MTEDALLQVVHRVVHEGLDVEAIPWGDIEDSQLSLFRFLLRHETTRYLRKRQRASKAQRKALGLLRSFLTPEQRATLRRQRYVEVETPTALYRLYPSSGITRRVVRRKSKTYATIRYCYHDADALLPPADVSLAHFLMLHADEWGFLTSANAYLVRIHA